MASGFSFFGKIYSFGARIINLILGARLTYKVLMGFVFGVIAGLFFRYNTAAWLALGVNVAFFKTFGTLFVNLIKMIIGPLIFSSIVASIVSVKDGKKIGSMAIYSVATFITMTTISVLVGMAAVEIFKPGINVSFDKDAIISQNRMSMPAVSECNLKQNTVWDFLFNIVPSNIVNSFLTNDFMQIIFFATIFAIAILKTEKHKDLIAGYMTAFSEVMLTMSNVVMKFAPFGIFGITSWLFGTQDVALIGSLLKIIAILYGSCLFCVYVLYSIFCIVVLKLNPLHFFRKMIPAQMFGFLLASSSAALPITLNICRNKLGVSEDKTNFVVPLGATMNMNGGAVHLSMSTMFIAQLWNVQFCTSDYISLVMLCVLGAIGTAPVPGASIFLLIGILNSMHLPIEAIVIILAVDRILDMARTFTNLTGDAFSAVIVDRLSGTLDKNIYNSK